MRLNRLAAVLGIALAVAAVFIVPGASRAQDTWNRAQLNVRAVQRAAVDAAVWGMPIVSVEAMREAYLNVAGAQYNDILYWTRPSTWKNQFTTPNASNLYVYFNFNLKDGPVVLEVPAAAEAGLFGTILDAWQVPLADIGPQGADAGKGGKYLILPPDYQGALAADFIVVRSTTYNGYGLFRAIPPSRSEADVDKALAMVKEQRLYPLSAAANPPTQRFIDPSDTLLDGIVRFDQTFYERLARMINEEPVRESDLALLGFLRTIGIEKGRDYVPDPALAPTLDLAAAEAHAIFVNDLLTRVVKYWPDRQWTTTDTLEKAARSGFTFAQPDYVDVQSRGTLYYVGFAPPAKLGAASYYLNQYLDPDGRPLDGSKTYRLRIPPNVPAEQFWAVTVYDLNTAGFIREAPVVSRDSYDEKMTRNADGSVDITFGPDAPAGQENNWIYTAPASPWFAMFRFYGPTPALFDKSWKPGDIEAVAQR